MRQAVDTLLSKSLSAVSFDSSVLIGTLASFLQFQNHSVSITYSSVGNDLHAGKHSRCDDHHSCIKTLLASCKRNAHMEKMTSVIVIPEAYYTLTITVIIQNVDLSITQSQTRIDGLAKLQTQLRASQWMSALSFAHFLSISFSASNAKQSFCSGLQTCKTFYAPPLPLYFLLIKEPWPRLVSFRCCLWIAAHRPHFNFLIASINNDWGRKSSRRWLDVTCMSKATSVAHLHSSGALQRRAENHFNDCDVKHSCIKTMSHSAKAAIIGIKTLKLQQVVHGNSVFWVGLAVIHFPPL